MTYDPYGNANDPRDSYYRRSGSGSGGAGLLLVMALLVLGGFIYYFSMQDRTTVASTDMRAPITQPDTTGSAAPADSATPIPTPPPRPAQ